MTCTILIFLKEEETVVVFLHVCMYVLYVQVVDLPGTAQHVCAHSCCVATCMESFHHVCFGILHVHDCCI